MQTIFHVPSFAGVDLVAMLQTHCLKVQDVEGAVAKLLKQKVKGGTLRVSTLSCGSVLIEHDEDGYLLGDGDMLDGEVVRSGDGVRLLDRKTGENILGA